MEKTNSKSEELNPLELVTLFFNRADALARSSEDE
jgi:hypothetical protein